MSRRWRVHHPELPAAPGARVTLGPGESHHLARVLRLRAGERLGIFDGRGSEWLARLVDPAPVGAVVELEREVLEPVEAALPVTLYQASCRPERLEWVVQKACEVGVAEIRIVESSESRAAWTSPKRLERLGRIAVEACKQSARRIVPPLRTVAALPRLADVEGLGLLLTPGAERLLAERLAGPRPASVRLAVGSEGGFTGAEVRAALEAGWIEAGLGPRILRTETAGLVAAAIVLHRWADLGRGE